MDVVNNEPLGLFSNLKSPNATNALIPIEPGELVETEKKKRKPRTKKIAGDEVVLAEGSSTEVDRSPNNIKTYMDTYADTTEQISGTIRDIDYLCQELNKDLATVRQSRSLKGKYTYICNMNSALANLISTKVTAIREQNNSIKTANQMDYTKYKDNRMVDAMNDDKMVMDMYNAFVNAPVGQAYNAPSVTNMTLPNTPGIQGMDAGTPIEEAGYQNYLNNLNPVQNMMRMEGNPNIQNVVVWDQATGAKYFAVYDTSTGQPVPNTVARDQMFMEDTTIDERNMIAKNINLNETYPVIVINKDNGYSAY